MNDKTKNTNKQPSFKQKERRFSSESRFNDKKRSPKFKNESGDRREQRDSSESRNFNSDRRTSGDSSRLNQRFSERGERREQRDSNESRGFRTERRSENHRDGKPQGRNSERFSKRPQTGDKKFSDRGSKRSEREDSQQGKASFAWPEAGQFTGESGQGNIKSEKKSVLVTVKGLAKSQEKKSGPLSPRAPEKIRKNRTEEMKVYGEAACAAIFAERPESIVRLWLTVEAAKRFPELMSYLAANKKAYHVVESKELHLVCGSEHHGGICLLTKKRTPMTLKGYLQVVRHQDSLLWIDNIQNAYNVGGMLRTAAYYGCKGVISNDLDGIYSPAAMRVAEGGAEHVYVLQIQEKMEALQQLQKAGYQIVMVTENKQATPLNSLNLTDKIVFILSEDANFAQLLNSVNGIDNVVLSFDNPLKSQLNSVVKSGVLLSRWYFR